MSKIIIALICFYLSACNTQTNSPKPEEAKGDTKPDTNTSKCLAHYGLPSSLLKSEEHKFSKDCSFLSLPESSLVDHYKLKLESAGNPGDCAEVQNNLSMIESKKSELITLTTKKRAEATKKYDEEISKLKNTIEELSSSPIMAKKVASVFVAPVRRHRLVDELKFMAERGLSYSLDSSDMTKRKLHLKSYLVKSLDQEIEDEEVSHISNLFYCSLSIGKTKDQVYLEYKGEFNTRPFVHVFDAVLD